MRNSHNCCQCPKYPQSCLPEQPWRVLKNTKTSGDHYRGSVKHYWGWKTPKLPETLYSAEVNQKTNSSSSSPVGLWNASYWTSSRPGKQTTTRNQWALRTVKHITSSQILIFTFIHLQTTGKTGRGLRAAGRLLMWNICRKRSVSVMMLPNTLCQVN